jgi:GTP-binding protein
LVHVVDISGSEGRDPYEDYLTINKELEKYSEKVYNTPQIIALNKSDLVVDDAIIEDFKKKVTDKPIYVISAAAYMGIDPLLKEIVDTLKTIPVPESMPIEETLKDMANIKEYTVTEVEEGYFEVTGPLIDNIAFGVVLDEVASMAYFQKRLKDEGIIDKLKSMGMVEGDTVRMCNLEFEYWE